MCTLCYMSVEGYLSVSNRDRLQLGKNTGRNVPEFSVFRVVYKNVVTKMYFFFDGNVF